MALINAFNDIASGATIIADGEAIVRNAQCVIRTAGATTQTTVDGTAYTHTVHTLPAPTSSRDTIELLVFPPHNARLNGVIDGVPDFIIFGSSQTPYQLIASADATQWTLPIATFIPNTGESVVFHLIGQSNADGRAVKPSGLTNTAKIRFHTGELITDDSQLSLDNANNYGAEAPLTDEDLENRNVILAKTTRGGISAVAWQRDESATHYAKVDQAVALLPAPVRHVAMWIQQEVGTSGYQVETARAAYGADEAAVFQGLIDRYPNIEILSLRLNDASIQPNPRIIDQAKFDNQDAFTNVFVVGGAIQTYNGLTALHYNDVGIAQIAAICAQGIRGEVTKQARPSAGNVAPVAVDDSVSLQSGETVIFDVLANDTDTNINPALTSIQSGPAHGTATISNGVITYTHNGSANTSDSITYRVFDDLGEFDDGVVTLTVQGTPWTPAQITTAQWLDGLDDTTMTVSQWTDKSGNNRHAAETDPALQPTPVSGQGMRFVPGRQMTFDGAYAVGVDVTFFVVARRTGPSVYYMGGVTRPTGANPYMGWQVSTNLRFARWGNWNNNETVPTYAVNDPAEIHTFNITSTGSNGRRNGTPFVAAGDANGHTTSWVTATLGRMPELAANNGDAFIGELVAVVGTLSTADRDRMEGYLAHRHGIQAGLDPSHPYKTTRPEL